MGCFIELNLISLMYCHNLFALNKKNNIIYMVME